MTYGSVRGERKQPGGEDRRPRDEGRHGLRAPADDLSEAREGLSALADRTRREIFERLVEHPATPGELAQGLPISRPAVSQHLKALKQAGLVVDTARGTRRVYQVNPDGLAAMRAYLEVFWNRALEAFKAAAERPTKEVT